MLKRLLIFFLVFATIFGIEEDVNFYDINYQADQKLINVKNEAIYIDMVDKLNNQYYVDVEFLVENGILPFTTFYMLEENKDYSAEINIISSYQIEGVEIELDNQVINNNIVSERLNLYKELGNLNQENDLQEFENKLNDRFGEIPIQVEDLLECSFHPLRNIARMTMPEEKFHAKFGEDFTKELITTEEGKKDIQAAINSFGW